MEIKKGDTVKIMSGKDKGKTGKVARSFPSRNSVLIEGINVHKKNSKPKKQGQKGQIIDMPGVIKAANVQIVCTSCKKAVKIGQRVEGEKKFRVCKKCGANL